MSDDNELHRLGLKLKFAYSIVGLVLGLACIIAGVILGLGGVAGKTTWTASFLGFNTNLNDAAPGVIIFIVGIFFVLITRFKVRDRTTVSPLTSANAPFVPTQSPEAGPAADARRDEGEAPIGRGPVPGLSYARDISYHSNPPPMPTTFVTTRRD
jgi:hypothetical protein